MLMLTQLLLMWTSTLVSSGDYHKNSVMIDWGHDVTHQLSFDTRSPSAFIHFMICSRRHRKSRSGRVHIVAACLLFFELIRRVQPWSGSDHWWESQMYRFLWSHKLVKNTPNHSYAIHQQVEETQTICPRFASLLQFQCAAASLQWHNWMRSLI